MTRDYRYYITKADWNPNQPLRRDSFDLNPFCVVDGGMIRPPFDVTHDCNVPDRKGYHVILALWDVGDTAATFYQVIDVEVNGTGAVVPGNGGSGPKPPVDPGKVTPPAPGNPGAGTPGCKDPSVGKKSCKALPGAAADNQWCNLNCNHNPSFCPIDLCSCTGDSAALEKTTPGAGVKLKVCQPVPGSAADAPWCNINCNNNPSFCPADFCSCQ